MSQKMTHDAYQTLVKHIASYDSMLVAYSGGVDSTLLAKAAYDALGDKALAVTIAAPQIQQRELMEATNTAKMIGIKHHILQEPLLTPLQTNPKERCYLCKHHLFTTLQTYATKKEIAYVAEGSNLDDTKEHRPGHKALKELGILTPMVKVALSKQTIRSLSQTLNLPTWDKPSSPCLLTRFPYETRITEEQLGLIEKAEDYLITKGYTDIRVRYEHNNARIEMPHRMKLKFMMDRNILLIAEDLKAMGFSQVTLDLQLFRHEAIEESMEHSHAS